MFCKNCGSPVNDNDMVCKNCGAMTEYGEKVSRHEAMPPTSGAVNPDGTLNQNPGQGATQGQGVNLNDQFGSGAQGGYQPPYSAPQNTNNPNGPGGYYYAPQNGGYYPPQPQDTGESNSMAIAGFVCSFFIPLLGLIFSIIGLNKSKNLNGRGRGMAIAGIVISVASWVLGIIIISAAFGEMDNYYGMISRVLQVFSGL